MSDNFPHKLEFVSLVQLSATVMARPLPFNCYLAIGWVILIGTSSCMSKLWVTFIFFAKNEVISGIEVRVHMMSVYKLMSKLTSNIFSSIFNVNF